MIWINGYIWYLLYCVVVKMMKYYKKNGTQTKSINVWRGYKKKAFEKNRHSKKGKKRGNGKKCVFRLKDV